MKATQHVGRASIALLAGTAIIFQGVTPVAATESEVTAGYVDWGIKESWRNYIGASNTTLSDGVTQNEDGSYRWPVTAGQYDVASDTLKLTLGGAVHFQKHCLATRCLLDSKFSDLTLVVSPDAAYIQGDYTGSLREEMERGVQQFDDVRIADLDVADLQKSEAAGWTTLTDVPAVAGAGMHLYDAGTEIDPVSAAYTLDDASKQGDASSTAEVAQEEVTPTVDSADTDSSDGDTATENGGVTGLLTMLINSSLEIVFELFGFGADETDDSTSDDSSDSEATNDSDAAAGTSEAAATDDNAAAESTTANEAAANSHEQAGSANDTTNADNNSVATDKSDNSAVQDDNANSADDVASSQDAESESTGSDNAGSDSAESNEPGVAAQPSTEPDNDATGDSQSAPESAAPGDAAATGSAGTTDSSATDQEATEADASAADSDQDTATTGAETTSVADATPATGESAAGSTGSDAGAASNAADASDAAKGEDNEAAAASSAAPGADQALDSEEPSVPGATDSPDVAEPETTREHDAASNDPAVTSVAAEDTTADNAGAGAGDDAAAPNATAPNTVEVTAVAGDNSNIRNSSISLSWTLDLQIASIFGLLTFIWSVTFNAVFQSLFGR